MTTITIRQATEIAHKVMRASNAHSRSYGPFETEKCVDGFLKDVGLGFELLRPAYADGDDIRTIANLAKWIRHNAIDSTEKRMAREAEFQSEVAANLNSTAYIVEQHTGHQYEPIENGNFKTLDAAKAAVSELATELGWTGLRVVLDNGPRTDLSGRALTGDDAREVVFEQGA